MVDPHDPQSPNYPPGDPGPGPGPGPAATAVPAPAAPPAKLDKQGYQLQVRAARFDLTSSALAQAKETAARANDQAREGLQLATASVDSAKLLDGGMKQLLAGALHSAAATKELARRVREAAEEMPQTQAPHTGGWDVLLELVKGGSRVGEAFVASEKGQGVIDALTSKVAGLLGGMVPPAAPPGAAPSVPVAPSAPAPPPAPPAHEGEQPTPARRAREARLAELAVQLPDDLLQQLVEGLAAEAQPVVTPPAPAPGKAP